MQRVLQNLLRERVSILNAASILEAFGEAAPITKITILLTEYVQQAIRRQVVKPLLDTAGDLTAHFLEPATEQMIESAVEHAENSSHLNFPPQRTRYIQQRIKKCCGPAETPVVQLRSSGSRFFVRQITESIIPNRTVLSHNEIPPGNRIVSPECDQLVGAINEHEIEIVFADTIEDAISQARLEMGSDAMLVNSKRSGTEARHRGAYEVVCAGETEARSENPAGRTRSAPEAPPMDRLSQDVTELKQQMERLALTLARLGAAMAGIAAEPDSSKVFAPLMDADLYARMVAVVGPPGSGKTTELVKLALRHAMNSRKRSQILTLDTCRIAAADESQSDAAIFGIGCEVLETTAALGHALEQHRDKDLILIDRPGFAGMDTDLILPASMRPSDLRRAAQRYEIFGPRKLLFTRLDENQTFGPIPSHSVRKGKPVSYLSGGQRISEDLEAATRDLIVDMVLKSQPALQTRFGAAAA